MFKSEIHFLAINRLNLKNVTSILLYVKLKEMKNAIS